MRKPLPPYDLSEWIYRLRHAGELCEIGIEVDPYLEITEIVDRVVKQGGPALLFKKVRGWDGMILANQFGSDRRLALAFGVQDINEIAGRIEELFDLAKPPNGLRGKLGLLGKARELASMVPPQRVRSAPCQEVVQIGDQVNLDELPILTCWPEDGGPYITLPLVFTRALDGTRNCGMYRVQKFDRKTCGMHWQIHKDGAADWRHMPASGRLEVAVAIGTDPITTYAASCPLPKEIDEMLFAGFARRRRVEMVRCRTVDLEVPANAEIVLEGYVEQGELRTEGPFGDHTGYYSLADEYPVFHVTAITRRRNAVYSTTIVGVPPHEDKWIGKATERIFLPLLRKVQHEIVDYDLPCEGVFHGCCIVSIDKSFPGHAKKIMHAIWGTALLSLTKSVIVVDGDVDVHDYAAVASRIAMYWDPEREADTLFSSGPLDVLDHAPDLMGYGGKIGIDATRGWASEGRGAIVGSDHALSQNDLNLFLAGVDGLSAWKTDFEGCGGALVVLSVVDAEPDQIDRLRREIASSGSSRGIKLVVFVDENVDVDQAGEVAFRFFGNLDPVRDVSAPDSEVPFFCFDATVKGPKNGYFRDWPADIVMTEEVKQMVDDRWGDYGIPLPCKRTKPLVGLARNEKMIGVNDRARGAEGFGNREMSDRV